MSSALTSGPEGWIIVSHMKKRLPLSFSLMAAVLLVAGASDPLQVADPIGALSSLETGPELVVQRDLTRLDVGEPGATESVVSLARDGVATIRTELTRPAEVAAAVVREVQSRQGEVLWRLAHTARGARLFLSEPGVLHPRGLHMVLFDNDDVHVSTGDGDLMYARRTLPDGTLEEREGVDGCDCARSTSPEGVLTTEIR